MTRPWLVAEFPSSILAQELKEGQACLGGVGFTLKLESRILLRLLELNKSLFRRLLGRGELLLQLKSLVEMSSLDFLVQVLDLSVLSVLFIFQSLFVALKATLSPFGDGLWARACRPRTAGALEEERSACFRNRRELFLAGCTGFAETKEAAGDEKIDRRLTLSSFSSCWLRMRIWPAAFCVWLRFFFCADKMRAVTGSNLV